MPTLPIEISDKNKFCNTKKFPYLCIMKVRKDIQKLADELSAEVEIWADSESSYVIEATAPDDMEWVNSGGVSIVGRWWTYDNGGKEKEIDDFIMRMKMGLQKETT